jgi:hypothetical protein
MSWKAAEIREFVLFTIYEKPRDYPHGYVVRRWVTDGGPEPHPREAMVAATLEEARALVPPDLYRLQRSPEDDPCIVESWI